MIRALVCLVLLAAVASIAAPADAVAQPAASINKKQVAKQYVDAGLAAQSAGDYDAAITFYSKAYELVPHPTLIFNLAQAHRLAGRIARALSLYRRYLSEAPNGPQAKTARELVTEIEAHQADEARLAEAAHQADEARKAEEVRKAEEARKVDAASSPAIAERGSPPPVAASPVSTPEAASPDVAPGRSQQIAGIAVGAGGVVVLAIGIGFGLHARSLADQLSRDGAVYDPAKVHAGERANTIAIVGIAGGSALIAAGAVLYWRGTTQSRAAERVSLAPMLSPRAAGLVLSGALP
jgi:tetratricopeptide (TPR) repeat protein